MDSQNQSAPNNSLGSFGAALVAMRDGKKVYRAGWHLQGMWLKIQFPDENSANTLPYIYIVIPGTIGTQENTKAERVPWLASQTDMLATDWFFVEEV